ncbi:carboxypeptidase-like regulatory domain-containing protein [Porphyromonas loveana]|uniref:carboxypeptidase-like regulatory domain-containing protein n=1 Tax=Porphyromonas loveana TaxID=1884669 RepID=UPI0035A14892
MERRVSLLFCCLAVWLMGLLPIEAQDASGQMLSGRVIDAESRQPLIGAVCQLVDGAGNPIAFTLSKADGAFSLAKKDGGKLISVRHMGYKKQSRDVSEAGQPLLFALTPDDVKLKEVVVRTDPVRKLGDTISYSASAFAGPEDRYLADLLRKLPGIEVTADGMIKHNGEAITRMYIEGVDMLQNRYNLASNNLPQEAVSTVEVIENHQHVKTLRETVPEKRSALNIKLKQRFKIRPFGDIIAGGGISDLWTGRIFGMQVGKKVQAMLTAKGNNTGNSVVAEAIQLTDIESMQHQADDLGEELSHTGFQTLPMKQHRYLMNRSGTGSLTTAVPLTPEVTLTGVVSLLADRAEQTVLQEQVYNLGTPQELLLRENRYMKGNTRGAQADLSVENNASGFYFKDDLRMTLRSERERVRLATNATDYLQTGESLPRTFRNNLSVVFKGDKRTYRITSFAKYMDRQEDLLLTEQTTALPDMNPDVRTRDFVTRNALESSFLFGRISLHSTTTLGYRGTHTGYRSTLPMPTIEGMEGTYDYRTGQWSLNETPAVEYRRGATTYRLSVPLVWNYYTLEEAGSELRSALRFTASPTFSLSWNAGPSWKLSTRLAHNHSYGGLAELRTGYTRRDYRTYVLPSGFMAEKRHSGILLSAAYNDVLHLFYFRINANYSRNRTNELLSYDFTPEQNILRRELFWHDTDMFAADARLSKYIFSLKTNGTLTVRYSHMQSLLKQSGLLIDGRGNSLSAEVSLSKNWNRVLTAAYGLSANYSWMETGPNAYTVLPQYRHSLELTILPLRGMTTRISGEYSSTTLERSHVHEDVFFDCGADYDLSKRWSLSLTVRNLFDRREYYLHKLTEYNTFSTLIPIRGREFIATVRFRY